MAAPTELDVKQLISCGAVVLEPDKSVTEEEVDEVIAILVAAFPDTDEKTVKKATKRLRRSMVTQEGDDD